MFIFSELSHEIMSENVHGSDELILSVPSLSDAPGLLKSLRKLAPPEMWAGTDFANTRVGGFETCACDGGVEITWWVGDGPRRVSRFEELADQEQITLERLELGWMVANIFRIEALRALRTIPDPAEAMEAASSQRREEDRWRRWAIVGGRRKK